MQLKSFLWYNCYIICFDPVSYTHLDVYKRQRVHYGLIEPDEEDSVEEAQVEETSDELVLDLDSTIEIEE